MFARLLGVLVIAVPFALSTAVSAEADDLRVRQLESEVSRLQRELDAQSRRIDELERSVRNSSLPRAPLSTTERTDTSPAWLVSTNWDRLRPGMKEMDVIALLGRPTSVRTDSDGRIRSLIYAMELGPNAVLAGNVRLSDAGVAEINKPALK
jgi:predicted RNase H-like nuclease (RuvC/YqgF family)